MNQSLLPVSLWSDTLRSRFFLIPDEQLLPPGEFVIRTITGRKLEVDPASLAPFEKTEAEAKKWLESQFGKILDTARGAVDRFVDRLTGADADRLAPVRAAVEDLETAAERLAADGAPLTSEEIGRLTQLADRVTSLGSRLRVIP